MEGFEWVRSIKVRPAAGAPLIADITFPTTEGAGWVTALVRRTTVMNAPVGDAAFEIKYKIPEAVSDVSGGLLLPLFGGIVRVQKKIAVATEGMLSLT